ncbi:MAG: nucleotidyltransferase domain-containing protein [Thermofilum sp.]|nr:nucleotidyltransferase domain-containing protein [Thermofilum sp.]
MTRFLVGLACFRNIFVYGYASIDESLQEATFKEIFEKLPYTFDKLKRNVAGDPDPSIKSAFRRVASKHVLSYVFLFGSRARGGFGRYSDLAVAFKKKHSIALELDLLVVDPAKALGVHEELIDLVDLNNAPLRLVKTVVEEDKILYGDN